VARGYLANRVSFDDVLAKLPAPGKRNVERHLAACEAEDDPRHAELWRRLICTMMTLARHSIKLNGHQTAQFYVADGKYRMQVYALEDLRDGQITVYCGNVLDEAIAGGLLARREGNPTAFTIAGSDETLNISVLDRNTANPAPFFKDMVGWNRQALRISVPVKARPLIVDAVEVLCAIPAHKWLGGEAPSAAVAAK
jgi:hypothetical protein